MCLCDDDEADEDAGSGGADYDAAEYGVGGGGGDDETVSGTVIERWLQENRFEINNATPPAPLSSLPYQSMSHSDDDNNYDYWEDKEGVDDQ